MNRLQGLAAAAAAVLTAVLLLATASAQARASYCNDLTAYTSSPTIRATGLSCTAAQTIEPVGMAVYETPILTKVIYNDIGPTVQVGAPHKVIVKYTNRLFLDKKYLKYAKKKRIKPNIKMTAYAGWLSSSWPVLQSQGGTMAIDQDKTAPIPPTRWIKPHKSRTMRFLVNFKACLPPYAPDPQTPGTLDPSNRAFYGLPCASGFWYVKAKAYIRGLGWSSWSSSLGGDVYITPP